MKYFPMFMEVEGREVLVCGGGSHGVEKVQRLAPFGARIRVISENISAEMERQDGIIVERRPFEEKDLDSFPIFVVAAEKREESERIAGICRKRHIPVNTVDRQDICDFIFPAMIVSQRLCVGVSTGGTSPAAAVELKRRIAGQIPDNVDEILDWMADMRERVRRIPDRESRRAAFRSMVEQSFQAGRPLSEEELPEIMGRPV